MDGNGFTAEEVSASSEWCAHRLPPVPADVPRRGYGAIVEYLAGIAEFAFLLYAALFLQSFWTNSSFSAAVNVHS
jgi:hypothetical protein